MAILLAILLAIRASMGSGFIDRFSWRASPDTPVGPVFTDEKLPDRSDRQRRYDTPDRPPLLFQMELVDRAKTTRHRISRTRASSERSFSLLDLVVRCFPDTFSRSLPRILVRLPSKPRYNGTIFSHVLATKDNSAEKDTQIATN